MRILKESSSGQKYADSQSRVGIVMSNLVMWNLVMYNLVIYIISIKLIYCIQEMEEFILHNTEELNRYRCCVV